MGYAMLAIAYGSFGTNFLSQNSDGLTHTAAEAGKSVIWQSVRCHPLRYWSQGQIYD